MAVLSGEEIKKRVEDIFESGYDENCVDVASYNLRVNDVNMIINGKLYNEQNPYEYKDGFIRLPAKKISVISTIERLKLSKNLCARVGITFSFSRKGLIPLFGPQVDPGYNDNFYAVVYNTSSEDILLNKGDKILKMEILEVKGNVETKPSYFKPHEDYSLLRLTKDETIGRSTLNAQINDLKKEIDSIKGKVEEVSSGYRNIVWFGIFLISASIFGVILSFLLSSVNYSGIDNLIGRDFLLIIYSVIALFIIGWALTVYMVIMNLKEKKG